MKRKTWLVDFIQGLLNWNYVAEVVSQGQTDEVEEL